MAIDPTTTTTVKVGELGSAGYSTTDLIPHEVGGILKKGNLQDLATFIGEIIDVTGGVGFRAVEVNDGETLPATEDQEFILVGPGTYPNVGGGATITTTEPLNALVSNGTYWFIGVEIPITATGVWGTITGVLSDQTDLNNVLVAKADLVGGKVPNSQLPSYVDDVVEVANYAALPATGETGKIYVTVDTGNIYRWSGSAYIRIADESPVWGIITGTLSDQTDLQAALDGKFDVPTGNTTQYIAGDGSLVTFPVAGQAGTLVRIVRNTTGSTLTKGTVVYINGASGNTPTVAKAIATGDSTSAQTFGLVQSDISNNGDGYVVCIGDLIGINTSAISVGTQLYLSSTTAGAYTTTKQYAPAHLVYIGVVTRSHATLGQIEVKIQNGYELDELHDVAISSVANNEVIVYESATSLWKNKTIPTILGYTPANSATTLTINGTAYDLSTNRSWTIPTHDAVTIGTASGLSLSGQVLSLSVAHSLNTGALSSTDWTTFNNKIGGSGTINYLPKFTSSGAIGNSNILDNGSYVEILTGAIISGNLNVNGVVSSGTPSNSLSIISNSGAIFVKNSASNTAYAFQLNTSSGLDLWSTNSGGTSTRRMTLDSSGNVGIGTTTPSVKFVVDGGSGDYTPIWAKSSLLASSKYYSSLLAGYALTANQSAQFGYVYDTVTATNSYAHITPFGSAEGSKFMVRADGNVGIGTTSPASKLHVSFTSDSDGLRIQNSNRGNSYLLATAGGSAEFFSLYDLGSSQFLYFAGNSGHSWNTQGSERMRITSSGVVCIGTTSAFDSGLVCSDGGTSYVPYTAKIGTTASSTQMFFRNPNGVVGSISTSGTLTSFNVTSDYRLKQDFKEFNGLDLVSKIKVYDYEWKVDKSRMNGVIAHELQEVVPYAVTGEKDAEQMQSVDYSKLVPILVQAIQELKAEIEILKNK